MNRETNGLLSAITRPALGEFDRIAVWVRHPREAEIGEKVVRWAERRRAGGEKARVVAVGVVRPEHDLNGMPP